MFLTRSRTAERASVNLVLLLSADAAFILIHLVHATTPYLTNVLYSIEADGGFAEWFQYTKEFWAVLLLAIVWWGNRRLWAIGWILTFGYFLLDDAISIHELAGDIAYRHLGFGPALGLRAQDFGELFVMAITGLGIVLVNFLLYRRANETERALSRDLALLVACLVFFGVFLDMLHSEIQGTNLRLALGLIEDGGEMVTMSVICWYLLAVVDRAGTPPTPTLFERALKRTAR